MAPAPQRIAIVFGGPSPEHDVSVLTGLQAAHALQRSGRYRSCSALYWAKNGSWFEVPVSIEAVAFASGLPDKAKPIELIVGPEGGFVRQAKMLGKRERLELDAVLVCCHGGPGENGSLQAVLDLAGVAYSGPTALGATLGMDKLATGAISAGAGLPVLPRILLDETTKDPEFPGPYILKPRVGGSSIGIDVVADFATARARLGANAHLRHGAVLEPYRPDLFDLEIAIRTWPVDELSAIAKPLRTTGDAAILDYANKYVGAEGMASAPRELPAELSQACAGELRELAKQAAAALGVRGVARIDFLSDGKTLWLNEVNTIPGSLSRYLFIAPKLAFEELLGGLLEEATSRPAVSFSSVGSDGRILRGAMSIASKLA